MHGASVRFERNSAAQGRLRLGPLPRALAEEFGAALRRALLREVRGAAVSAVCIPGTPHEFAILEGVVEDVVQIVENLKMVRVSLDRLDPRRVRIDVRGPCTVTAGDLAAEPGVAVANPEQPIATVAGDGRLEMLVEIATGTGYAPLSQADYGRPGWIGIDRRYAPVRQVAIQVDAEGDATFLELRVTTDGTVPVEQALAQAGAALELRAGMQEPVPALCRAVVEAACRPRQTPVDTPPPRQPRIVDLGKTRPVVPVPDLAEMPKQSFEAFAPREDGPAGRRPQGLEGLLRKAFPLSLAGGTRVEYDAYAIGGPTGPPQDCVRFGRTYAGRLQIHLRDAGRGDELAVEAGWLPLVTDRGTFVISGVEKVVVARLQASEGDGPNDLARRRMQLVGDQLAAALCGPLIADLEEARRAASIAEVSLPRFAAALRLFFRDSSTCRPVEGTNPLAAVSQVRAVVQTGIRYPGLAARDVHPTHFGRLCLLETPEGGKIGVNLSAALLTRVDPEGRLLTPYCRADNGEVEYLSPEGETDQLIADLDADDGYTARYGGKSLGRTNGEIVRIDPRTARYLPAHPAQLLGASAGLIPFVAHDDANRALMGTNMQKQAVPLVTSEAPLVRTGLEARVAQDAGACLRAAIPGVVVRVTADELVIGDGEAGAQQQYRLVGFSGSAMGTCLRQRPVVRAGDRVSAGQLLAEGPASDGGLLALGRNVLVGYLPWEGYNHEDALVISERLIREDVFTSIWIRDFSASISSTAAASERFGSDHLTEDQTTQLAPGGVVRAGAWVEGGDVLIARQALQGGVWRDRSLRLPAGQRGTVVGVDRLAASHGDPLEDGIAERVRVTVAVRRRLKVGDKLANRHGGKGTVGLIVAEEDMPVLPDGRALDLLLDPLGVPSRMNLGQLLETHLGLAARALSCTVITPGFNGADQTDVDALLAEAGLPASGMLRLRDGRTGRQFDHESTVGYQYVMKLVHMVDDRLQARGAGHSLEPEEQLGRGPAGPGVQHLGIMETWALQAHGAGHILQEMLTVKADDAAGRLRVSQALLRGEAMPRPGVPRSVLRLVSQLRGLCLDLTILREDGREMDVFDTAVSIDDAASARLDFAAAERVREWSAGRPDAEDAAPLDEYLAGGDMCSIRHLELATPVEHPWRALVPDRLPEVAVLPVLPRHLRGGDELDRFYLEVHAADQAIRSHGATGERAAALQAAVDRVMGESGLTRLLYGKRGWFAAAMSGKAMDYSARSVAAPGCGLRYDECGLPRRMARVLFEPLVIGELVRSGHASSAAQARRLLRAGAGCAEAALERAVSTRWVLLHRAPVLHRWGIQACRPLLIDEDVVRLHPLMLVGFNADFDGDELGVFLPLSDQAQEEAASMRPSANQAALANYAYMNGPTQDMVLGWYYATVGAGGDRPSRRFASAEAVLVAWDRGEAGVSDPIVLGRGRKSRRTTVGRALFNRMLPDEWEWHEGPADRKMLAELMLRCWRDLGAERAARLGDALMRSGFRLATRSGLSIGRDVLAPYSRYADRIADAWHRADELEARGGVAAAATLVDHWLGVTRELAEGALTELAEDRGGLNPVHLMRISGARSNQGQIRQLVAMRGLLATPDRRIMAVPCTTSFIQGHSQLEYLASTYGARLGLSDTALRTANAGFLFKRIMNAVQDILIREEDCGAQDGIIKRASSAGKNGSAGLAQRLSWRTALAEVTAPGGQAPLVRAGTLITPEAATAIAALGVEVVTVRSPITCRTRDGVCAKCYGADLSQGRAAAPGLAAGVIAAQCIGEPMTQLMMRTFALGGLSRLGGALGTIVGGLPRLDELFEAGRRPGQEESPERAVLETMLHREGAPLTAEYLLGEIAGVYHQQGVLVDDRHFEVVLRQMLAHVRVVDAGTTGLRPGAIVPGAQVRAANAGSRDAAVGEPVVLGVTEVAIAAQDFLAAGIAHGGIPALAAAAAAKASVALDGVRSCTLFGKVVPTRGATRAEG